MHGNHKRNLFTYAAEGSAQGAFLSWLFYNFDDEEIGPAAYALLRKFCGLEKDEKIVHLYTRPQWRKFDITVWFITESGKEYALLIEDKTDCSGRNRPKKHSRHIDALEEKGLHVRKVCYDLGYVSPDAAERVKKSGRGEPFCADEIYEILKEFETSENLIVRQYVEHVRWRRDMNAIRK